MAVRPFGKREGQTRDLLTDCLDELERREKDYRYADVRTWCAYRGESEVPMEPFGLLLYKLQCFDLELRQTGNIRRNATLRPRLQSTHRPTDGKDHGTGPLGELVVPLAQ
jgi:hypothetical protein